MLKILITDLDERGGFNLLEQWEKGQLTVKQNPTPGRADLPT